MDDNNGKSSLLALTVATMLFAALGVVWYNQAPYKGIRPSVQVIPEAPQKIRARLWQDPFQAVLDYEGKKKPPVIKIEKAGGEPEKAGDKTVKASPSPQETKGTKGFSISPRQGTTWAKEFADKKNVTVLAAMVLGGPYDGDIEDRIDRRYAVLSALNVLGYYPDDPTHINYLNISSSSSAEQTEDTKVSIEKIIPFEWLSNNDAQSVLLLWLNEDIFQESPIKKLEKLGEDLSKNTEGEIPFKIIGPATSTTLLKMIEENRCVKGKNNISKLNFYTASATVDDDILINSAKIKSESCIEPETFLQSDNLVRTILTDRKLAEALSAELTERKITGAQHIVLIAEWDTDYGRSLPQIFEEVFNKTIYKDQTDKNKIHRYSYLRGIDGELPGEPNGNDKGKKKNDTNNKEERDVKKLEEPIGRSQYDYLRRLTARISHIEDTYGRNAIGAIGVLGNDFYDKFLVLQALQQRFPETIFFTTDLDARYLHPANVEWTRNLVVASSFGLQLREDLQKDVPPFRTAYQTSEFAATLLAFDYHGLKKCDFLPGHFKPRIFEIGRYNAVDLTNTVGDPAPFNQAFTLKTFSTWGWLSFTATLLGISILAMLLWSSWLSYNLDVGVIDGIKQFKQKTVNLLWFKEPKSLLLVWLISLGTILCIIIVVYNIISLNPTEEPFSWSEGISVWPTEIIRLIALILSIIFFFTAKERLQKNNISILDEFGLGCASHKINNIDSKNKLTKYFLISDNKWKYYLSRSTFKKRIYWIICVTVAYYALCFTIILLFGSPNNPVRGYFSGKLNFILLSMTILAFIVLTFYVLDTIMLCRGFITQFIDEKPQWNINSLQKFAKKWITDSESSSEDSPSPATNPQAWEKGRMKEALSEWMLVVLIARRTDVVGKFIFFPFIVWSLIIISRLHYFDNWRTPFGLVIVISLSAALAWICAVNLRRSAEKLRTAVINRLDQQLLGTYADDSGNKNDANCIQHVLNEVKAIKTGAFASYIQQPALQSLLVPIGGISGLKILELLSNLG